MRYFIKTFGCQANVADSERLAALLESRGMKAARGVNEADYVVINTCLVRQSAENRIYGLVNSLAKLKGGVSRPKIVVTGCLVGMSRRDRSGRMLKLFKERMPSVDEFLPIEEVGFNLTPLRTNKDHALVPISNGCNNYCSYCVVPYTRGKEISRSLDDVLDECSSLVEQDFVKVTLIGQNVNSYGADLVKLRLKGQKLKPVYVKHLGRYRIPTLFPYLLKAVALLGFEEIDFLSSNPWDFSDELIRVIAKHPNITRTIHLPVQSGDNSVLKRMNRWYSREEYLSLVQKIRSKVEGVKFTTDIIVGFPGETKEQFQNTVDLAEKVNFVKAYIAMYSPRPMTQAYKQYADDVPYEEKKRRWRILESLINQSSA